MANELDIVALKADRPDLKLKAGARGTVVAVLGETLEVEFAETDFESITTAVPLSDVVVVWTPSTISEGRRAAG